MVDITYHYKRSHDPIDGSSECDLDAQHLRLERMVQCFEANVTKDHVHHDEQTNCWNCSQPSGHSNFTGYLSFPLCNAGPVTGTKFPRMMTIIMPRRTQRARN
jgi:hypothetical protein